ncbi:unnamed protein product [Notodromas monacha]|uniref:Ion transport domain-containing protein n=1 Tax=Notodromas monacha TaxID=399045 RepID=A0A7R9BJG7_9CRUS|nr:unnamed protein product [Notodromas monacha]CAG0916599.1 unnamed protein product [Notodromas monacha]
MEDVLAFEDDFVPEPNPSIRRAYRPPTRTFSVYSESDGPNELGDTGVSSLPDHPCDFDWSPTHQVSNSSFVQEDISYQKKKEILWKWQMNYHEASIFLDEGANNVKFTSHPRNQAALPAYLVVHNRWFYTLELTSALLLLSLAIVEKPAYASFQVPLGVHASVEAVGLVIVGFETFMKIRWQGVRTFVCHKRSMIKACILIIMTVESVVILIRQSSHFRVMRALRPIFLIDNHYSRGVRRFIRQILQSLPPILDMLGLLFFFMVIFSILGFFLFSDNPRDPYFRTLFSSFVSLFVLLTTAKISLYSTYIALNTGPVNSVEHLQRKLKKEKVKKKRSVAFLIGSTGRFSFPDVMMPSYSQSRWASTFFITYLAIELYILMNLVCFHS